MGKIGKKLRGDPVQDRLTFIGPNPLDYTNLFERDSVWLWPGFLAPVPWAMGRKQWGMGWAAGAIFWVPVFASTFLPQAGLITTFIIIWLSAGAFFGATGRTSYAVWAEEKVKNLRFDKDIKDEDYQRELERRGGMSILGINLGVMMMVMPIMLGLSLNDLFYEPPPPPPPPGTMIEPNIMIGEGGQRIYVKPSPTPGFMTTMVDARGNPIEIKQKLDELPKCNTDVVKRFLSIQLEKMRLPYKASYVSNVKDTSWRGPGQPRFCSAVYSVPGNRPRDMGFYVSFQGDVTGDLALIVHRCVNCESLVFTQDMIAPVVQESPADPDAKPSITPRPSPTPETSPSNRPVPRR
ncbi:MAG: hypothetical protein Alpg2KO_14270 [Alphaproteobacteria bacterium]